MFKFKVWGVALVFAALCAISTPISAQVRGHGHAHKTATHVKKDESCKAKDCKCVCHKKDTKKDAHKDSRSSRSGRSGRSGSSWGDAKKRTSRSKSTCQRKGRMAHDKKEAAKKETRRFSPERWQSLRGGQDSERSARIKKFLEGMKKKASSAGQGV